jgi:dynein heavy chain 1
MPRATTVEQFINDLSRRLVQLEAIAAASDARQGIWLGGLFQPEAFLTATRQTIAHQRGWSLEQLELSLEVEENAETDSFPIEGEHFSGVSESLLMIVTGLKLEGAAWENGRLALNDGQSVSLKSSQLTWRKQGEIRERYGLVNIPVYLNSDRSDVLFSVDLAAEGLSQTVVAQRGVCITVAQ